MIKIKHYIKTNFVNHVVKNYGKLWHHKSKNKIYLKGQLNILLKMKMKKEIFTFLFVFVVTILFVFPFNLNPASALELASVENETYAIQINDLGCKFTDYEIHLDLWHLRITGYYTVTLNNSGDTDISIRWKEGSNDTSQEEKELIIPPKTVKKYSINFSFNLLSRDLSYEYNECMKDERIF